MDNYLKIKEESLKGNITDKLFPYLWEYYQDKASVLKVETFEEFSHAFISYTNIPVLMPGNRIITPLQELMSKLPHIFKYLDNKYKQPQQEATEK